MPAILELNPRVILLDIEGTTTPVSFVYQTLFPYAAQNVASFLRAHSHQPEITALLDALRLQHRHDAGQGLLPPPWREETLDARLLSAASFVRWLIARDTKCTPLKTLQGKIWQEGYSRGELRGEVYEDVPRAFDRWMRQGRAICIYSSGSVLAQQLLFRTTQAGDLTTYISEFFDTQVGAKIESGSYRKIAAALGRASAEILFISDATGEVAAARIAGMPALLCTREPDTTPSIAHSQRIHTFDEIC